MIKFENTDVYGFEAAIRGMRNPKNSWHLMDSHSHICWCDACEHKLDNEECNKHVKINNGKLCFKMGDNDKKLTNTLSSAGPVHGKFMRMINVTVDITAPLYWWKEFDTYKVGTVANSCSTMHKIHAKEFTLDDFSHEHLLDTAKMHLNTTIEILNIWRKEYSEQEGKLKKDCWWQMIQLLPSSYNQKRTVQLNYEVLCGVYEYRKNHKLDEWHEFCRWIESLPYSELITCRVGDVNAE